MKKIVLGTLMFFILLSSGVCGHFFANNFRKEIIGSYSKGLDMATDYFHKIERNLGINIEEELKKIFT